MAKRKYFVSVTQTITSLKEIEASDAQEARKIAEDLLRSEEWLPYKDPFANYEEEFNITEHEE